MNDVTHRKFKLADLLRRLHKLDRLTDAQLQRLVENDFRFDKQVQYTIDDYIDILRDTSKSSVELRSHAARQLRRMHRQRKLSINEMLTLESSGFSWSVVDSELKSSFKQHAGTIDENICVTSKSTRTFVCDDCNNAFEDKIINVYARYRKMKSIRCQNCLKVQKAQVCNVRCRCVETGEEYESFAELAKTLSVNPAQVSRAISYKYSLKGLHYVRSSSNISTLDQYYNKSVKRFNYTGRKVRCVELDRTFNSVVSAAKFANRSTKSILEAVNCLTKVGERRKCAGYHWEYVDESETDNA